MSLKWLVMLSGLVPMLAIADFCEERAAIALGELEGLISAGDTQAQHTARTLLVRVCREGQGAATAPVGLADGAAEQRRAASAESGTGAPADRKRTVAAASSAAGANEEQGARLLGIDFRKADADAPGRDRARKRP